jgi:hypothetical protein
MLADITSLCVGPCINEILSTNKYEEMSADDISDVL